jgi:hypothetical protein
MADPSGSERLRLDLLAGLTPRQRRELRGWQAELTAAQGWNGALPVALLDRCWLQLQAVPVANLAQALPPDASAEAPELVRYRQWIARGLSSWQAEQCCWQEFGSQACQQAQRRHWHQQDSNPGGWTLRRYLDLVATYRRQLETREERQLPLLVLGRAGTRDPHQLLWLHGTWLSMRHTCA